MSLEVRECADGRFELWEDGNSLVMPPRLSPMAFLAVPHTEVAPVRTGRGLAGELVAVVLDTARARGRQVLPQCPYVSAWMRRHPEYADLVPSNRRRSYGLPEA